MNIKTRFAPSPTGHLHIGGARTALFSWLHARRHGGRFVLRIEDTDRERSTQEYVDTILEGMRWLELDHDEGPYYQTQRMERYQEVLQRLLAEGHAYPCYCSRERLEALREQQLADKQKPRYDGLCRDRQGSPPPDISPVIRFRNPAQGQVIVEDLVRGHVEFDNAELDDLILARSDGTPTYNFCVVVDDADMAITHVIRGDDHLTNTPRQINILKALDVTPPAYAHVPMILGADGSRLSKRHGAVSVLQYREMGYVPEALVNYLVRLGWSHGDQEIFSREELIRLFDIGKVNKSASTFNPDKLLWLNQHYLKTLPAELLAERLQWQMARLGIDTIKGPALSAVVEAFRERAKTLVEMAEGARIFYQPTANYDPQAVAKHLTAEIRSAFELLAQRLAQLPQWQPAELHQAIIATAEHFGLKLGKIAQPLRVALTGSTVSPPIDVTLALLGRERSLARLQYALAHLLQQSDKDSVRS